MRGWHSLAQPVREADNLHYKPLKERFARKHAAGRAARLVLERCD
jgi:hypothetical protein